MYWTYGIVDPRTGLFVYVGQTNDFERRRRQHLSTHRAKKTRHAKGSIKTWLKKAHAAGLEPGFIILDIAETEEASLLSESSWIDKLGRQAGHPIRNLWDEHREILAEGRNAGCYEGKVFENSKVVRRVGALKPNAKKSGFYWQIPEDVSVCGPLRIDFLPKKDP